jgi:glycosyltransferase involved in cell wall biosynthesis
MACSEFSAKMIEEAIDHKVEVLYPPISDFFKADVAQLTGRNNLVVTVSRFAKEKRLEIVPRIAKRTPNDFSFVIVGACRCSDDLLSVQNRIRELGVEKKVRLIPNISRNKLRDIMHRSKVCLHTGANEPFGISILEAMSSGCVPVVPDSGGPKEFVPKQLRYETVEEAASLTESSVLNWSPQKAKEFIRVSDRFSEEVFSNEFLKITKL